MTNFEINNYEIIRNHLNESTCSLFYNYVKLLSNRQAIKYEILNEKYEKHWDGNWEDPQAIGSFSHYGDPLMDTLLCSSLDTMQAITNKELVPTYSYFRLYQEGDILTKHLDRGSCEISTTICLGENNTNLKDDYCWSFYLENKNNETTKVDLKPGDMLVYKGCELSHWREELKGLNLAQVFLHYNDKSNKNNNFMDGRPMFGLPKHTFYKY